MNARRNDFKRRLAAGERVIGLWCSLCSPLAAEALADAGFDWLLFDTEHSPIEASGVMALLQAAATSPSALIVRPDWNDKVLIKRYLDIGAQTLLIPFIETAEEAREAVRATRYPTLGTRGVAGVTRASGWGRAKDYFKVANDEICIILQVETREALARLPEIAAVEGVDAVFIGPSDLSASFGHIGNPLHPEVQEAIAAAATTIRAAGKAAGILTQSQADAKRYIEMGYTFVGVGADLTLMIRAADALALAMREVP